MEKPTIIFLLTILQVISVSEITTEFSKQSTPNYRSLLDPTIQTNNGHAWVLIFSSQPSGWSNISRIPLPIEGTGSRGLAVKFNITENTEYKLSLEIDTSSVSSQNISFSWDSNYRSTSFNQNPTITTVTFTIIKEYYYSTQMLYIWLENGLAIKSFIIEPKVEIVYSSVNLVGFISQKKLVAVTDIPLSRITNINLFINSIKIELAYNNSISSECSNSAGSSTNPAKYSGYWPSTNYTDISKSYSYKLLANNEPYKIDNSSANIEILIENIIVDCSAIIKLYLGEGFIQGSKYTKYLIFPEPTIVYKYSYIDLNLIHKYIYQIDKNRFEFALKGLYHNPSWNEYELMQRTVIKIDSALCSINLISQWNTDTEMETQFYCQNSTPVTKTSFVEIMVPDDYLRKEDTFELYRFASFMIWDYGMEFSDTSQNFLVEAEFCPGIRKFKITFVDVTVLSTWDKSLLPFFTYVKVNGQQIDNNLLKLASHSMNFLSVYTYLPSEIYTGANIEAWIDSQWNLRDIRGSRIEWKNPTNRWSVPLNFFTCGPLDIDENENENQEIKTSTTFRTFAEGTLFFTTTFSDGVGFFMFNYLINSLIAFQNLIFLYYFVQFESPISENRKIISETMNALVGESTFEGMFQKFFRLNINFSPPEQTTDDPLENVPERVNQNRLYDYGYVTSFIRNNFEGIISVCFTVLKVLLILVITKIPFKILKFLSGEVLSSWKELVCIEIIMMAPALFVVLAAHCPPSLFFGAVSLGEKMNLCLMISVSFVCVWFCVVIYIFRFNKKCEEEEEERNEAGLKSSSSTSILKDKKNNSKSLESQSKLAKQTTTNTIINKKKIAFNLNSTTSDLKVDPTPSQESKRSEKYQELVLFVDNSLYIIVPFLVGIGNKTIFILFTSSITTYRLGLTIKRRKHYILGYFIKELIDKSLWFIFNSVYICYWFIDILESQCAIGSTCFNVLLFLGNAEAFIFLCGCLIEVALNLIIFVYELFETIKKGVGSYCKKNKVKHLRKELSQIKNEKEVTETKMSYLSKKILMKKENDKMTSQHHTDYPETIHPQNSYKPSNMLTKNGKKAIKTEKQINSKRTEEISKTLLLLRQSDKKNKKENKEMRNRKEKDGDDKRKQEDKIVFDLSEGETSN